MALPSSPCCHARCWRLHRGSRQRVLLVGFVGIAGVSRWSSAPTSSHFALGLRPCWRVCQSNPNVPSMAADAAKMQRTQRTWGAVDNSTWFRDRNADSRQQHNNGAASVFPPFQLLPRKREQRSACLSGPPPSPHPMSQRGPPGMEPSAAASAACISKLRRQGVARPASRRMAGGELRVVRGCMVLRSAKLGKATCRSWPERVLDARCQRCNLAVCHGQSALRCVPIAAMAELSWTVSSAVAVAEAASCIVVVFCCCCCLLRLCRVLPTPKIGCIGNWDNITSEIKMQ